MMSHRSKKSTWVSVPTEKDTDDKMDYVKSWVSDVNVDSTSPSTSIPQQDKLFKISPRPYNTEQENRPSKHLLSSSSRARVDRIQSLLYEDMSGHRLDVRPSRGRYTASAKKDAAFSQICFSDLSITKDVLDNTISIGLSGHQLKSLEVLSKSSLPKSVFARSGFIKAKQDAGLQESRVSMEDADSHDESVKSDVEPDKADDPKPGPSNAPEHEETAEDSVAPLVPNEMKKKPKIGNMGSLRGMLGIGKWKVKSKKHGIKGMRAFAKDEAHHAYIVDNMEKTAVETPLPLQKLILEEAFKAVKPTVKDYLRVLGKKDPLTRGAMQRLDEMTHTLRMCECL